MYKECAGSAGFGGSEPEEHFIHAGNIRELRLYQGLFGFCVGDALGVPVEFSDRRKRKADPVREMRAYGTYHQPAGTWSDDTSLMLCLIDAVNQGYSIQKAADNFVDFFQVIGRSPTAGRSGASSG